MDTERGEPMKKTTYGPYGRFARWVFRLFSRKYTCRLPQTDGPALYVCRHLNMHGPYTTMKWLPFEAHPLILHVFFQRKTMARHLTEYTFSQRFDRKPRRFSPTAHVLSWVTPPLMRSLQAVPVYRDGAKTVNTVKQGLKYLQSGENLIVYPDIHYTDGYGTSGPIYDGFLFIAELYYRKTGRKLPVVPLFIDDKKRSIVAGTPVELTDFRKEREQAAAYLQQAINQQEKTPA